MSARPFLKWVGGKTQLLPQMESYIPARFTTYHEPFLGGGALFFHLVSTGRLRPNGADAVLSDMNLRLIRTYIGVRDDVEKIINALAYFSCDAETYYIVRDRFNLSEHRGGEVPAWETAALFIYLNKCGFNGLYRENPKGLYNVPFGHFAPDHRFLDPDNLRACSKALQGAVIIHQSFIERLGMLTANVGQIADSPPDFVYCFLPGASTRYADETEVPIEAVKVGDVLLGGRVVQRTFQHNYSGNIRALSVQGIPYSPVLTHDHPTLTIPGRPSHTRQDTRSIQTLSDAVSLQPASALNVGDYVLLPTRGVDTAVAWRTFWLCTKVAEQARDVTFVDTEEEAIGCLLGYYAAEGHISYGEGVSYSVIWSFHEKERTYVEDVIALCRRVFKGSEPYEQHGPVRDVACTQVVLNCKQAAHFFAALVPGQTRARDEAKRFTLRLNPVLLAAPIAVQKPLLRCWLRGDAGVWAVRSRGKTKLTGSSSSPVLARQMHRIAQRCGVRPSWKLRGKDRSQAHDVYFSIAEDIDSLGFSTTGRKRQSCATRRFIPHKDPTRAGYIAVRITYIEDVHYEGPVHNVEVDDDHMLCVDGIFSHNCDPPYIPLTETADFTDYNAGGFNILQHQALAHAALRVREAGAYVLLSNSGTPRTREVYADFEQIAVDARRSVNCDPTKRGRVTELLLR